MHADRQTDRQTDTSGGHYNPTARGKRAPFGACFPAASRRGAERLGAWRGRAPAAAPVDGRLGGGRRASA
eukprot:2294557-Pyramimonas_sp.AAC.1